MCSRFAAGPGPPRPATIHGRGREACDALGDRVAGVLTHAALEGVLALLVAVLGLERGRVGLALGAAGLACLVHVAGDAAPSGVLALLVAVLRLERGRVGLALGLACSRGLADARGVVVALLGVAR